MTLSIGVSLSTSAAPGTDPVADARRAEELGYDFLTVSDHPSGTHPSFETWTLLTHVAAHTERIKLLTNVLAVPYRPPALVAKMAESLDRLSRGRLMLGLGAGGNDDVLHAMGLTMRTPGGKVEALAEEIEIVRRLWQGGDVNYQGRQFQLNGARITPPAERYIPIWVGAYGPKSVELTGRLADGWSPSLPYMPLDRGIEMRKRLRAASEAAGRSPDEVTCNYNLSIGIDSRAKSDSAVVGSVDQVVDRIMTFVRAGFTSISFWPIGEEQAQVTRLAEEVLPRLREAASS